jgi:HAE1 family hydrophobic/amphiphilic exporter-1
MLCARWLEGPIAPAHGSETRETRETTQPELAAVPTADTGELDLDEEDPDPAPGDRKQERAQYREWARGTRTVADVPGALAGGGHEGGGAIYRAMERVYLRLLAAAMRHRWVVALVLVGTLGSIVPLVAAVPKNFLPNEDESRLEITVRAPEGTSLAQTQIYGERLARAVAQLPEVDTTVLTVGAPAGDVSGRGPNQASLYVRLIPAAEREVSQDEIVVEIRNEVLPGVTPEGVTVLVSPIAAFGGSGQQAAPVQYIISGEDIPKLDQYTNAMLERVREIEGVSEASSSLITGRPAYSVQIDRRRAADLGVTVTDVSNALRLLVGGLEVTNYSEGGERYEVRVRADLAARTRPEQISRITVPSSTGKTVRLSDVATITETTGPAVITHYGRERQSTIFINTLPGSSEQSIIEELETIKNDLDLDPGYRGQLYGRSRELGRAMQSFLTAVTLSFVFMYLVLAAQFGSWLHPITIIASLPLTLPFALFSVWVFGGSLNLYSMLGVMVLFGVVKKNSILQIDHMRSLRRHGLSRADAVMVGNRDRLRPILMTTIAFVAGMIPLLVSSGAGSGTNRAMGTVIAGGQTLSLLLTLLATPVIYSWLDDLAHARAVKRVWGWLSWPLVRLDRLVSAKPHS